MSYRARTVAAGAVLFAAAAAPADIIYNEAVHGDLSGDPFNPTALVLPAGATSSIVATTDGGDLEYVRITVPDSLTAIVHASWASQDPIAFIGVQAGPVFTEDPFNPNVANLLGWAHFGPGVGSVGNNILPSIGSGPGAIGFTPPLGAGTYTFWIQQLGTPSTYQLDFVVIPAPGAGELVLAGAAALAVRRRR